MKSWVETNLSVGASYFTSHISHPTHLSGRPAISLAVPLERFVLVGMFGNLGKWVVSGRAFGTAEERHGG